MKILRNNALFFSLIIILTILLGCSDDGDTTTQPSNPDEIQITALIPLSGELGGYGEQLEAILALALEDANQALEVSDAEIRINLHVRDTETDPVTAREQFELAAINGCRYFIGPLTSGEMKEIAESVAIEEAILFSPSSTSQELAVADDHIFRLVPSDSLMVRALAEVIDYEGKSTLVTMSREDSWGLSVTEIIGNAFTNLGGSVPESYQYFSYRRSYCRYILTEIAGLLESMNQPSSTMAIQLTSLEEGNQVIAVAKEMEADYPILGQVQWYGSDGIVQNDYMLTQGDTCGFAAQTQFLCPVFGYEEGSDYTDVVTRFHQTISGDPWTYSVITYDAFMMMATVLGATSDPEAIGTFVNALPDVVDDYPGLSGLINFDANGDRDGGIFDFYRVVEEGETYAWQKVLKNDNGTITAY